MELLSETTEIGTLLAQIGRENAFTELQALLSAK